MTKINPIGNDNNSGSPSSSGAPKETKESLFTRLDTNKDGKISYSELFEGGYKGNNANAIFRAIFLAERHINKWFVKDKNYDGLECNVESDYWQVDNKNYGHLYGDLTTDEYAQKMGLSIQNGSLDNLKDWIDGWINEPNPMVGIKEGIKKQYGVELNEEETQLLYDAAKMQMNRWLFKSSALYNRLNNNAYTRLMTMDEKESCCGGDISMPPTKPLGVCTIEKDHLFSSIKNEGDLNTSKEMKTRLAWGVFKTLSQEQMDNITPQGYEAYQKQWQRICNMKASDYRDLLKPGNEAKLKEFELNSNMTVKQIVDYIDIVESTTGQDYDSDNWSVSKDQFIEIAHKVNGTYGDENILQGKARADIPEGRQDLLKYLEENDLLLDQFKQ